MIRLITITKPPLVNGKWQSLFDDDIPWKEVYLNFRKCTKDIKLIDFQLKFIHRIIYTKKELLKMKLVDSDICSFCDLNGENLIHEYWECEYV